MEKDNIIPIKKAKENSFTPFAFTKAGNIVMNPRFLALLLAGATAASIIGTSLIKDVSADIKVDIANKTATREFLQENGGYLVDKFGWHSKTDVDTYGFNHEGIARGILESENPDLALYAVYLDMLSSYDSQKNIDMVIREMDIKRAETGEKPYGSFDGYIESMGVSREKYFEGMRSYVDGQMLAKQSQDAIRDSGMKF